MRFGPAKTRTERTERRGAEMPSASSSTRRRRNRWMAAECSRSATRPTSPTSRVGEVRLDVVIGISLGYLNIRGQVYQGGDDGKHLRGSLHGDRGGRRRSGRDDPGRRSRGRERSRCRWRLGADARAVPLRPRPRGDREAHVGALDVFEAAALGEVDRLREILDGEPTSATAYSGDGFTALHFAAFFGGPEAAELLLERGRRGRRVRPRMDDRHGAAFRREPSPVGRRSDPPRCRREPRRASVRRVDAASRRRDER